VSEAVTVNGFRQRLAAHMAGVATLAPIAYVAFGDGGHNADMTPKAAGSSATALYHEVLRKPLTSISQEDLLSVTGKGVVDSSEIVGGVISEAGLIDADGHLVGWKTFAPKFTEEGETYGVTLKLRF
jgi:hypothetical protein